MNSNTLCLSQVYVTSRAIFVLVKIEAKKKNNKKKRFAAMGRTTIRSLQMEIAALCMGFQRNLTYASLLGVPFKQDGGGGRE